MALDRDETHLPEDFKTGPLGDDRSGRTDEDDAAAVAEAFLAASGRGKRRTSSSSPGFPVSVSDTPRLRPAAGQHPEIIPPRRPEGPGRRGDHRHGAALRRGGHERRGDLHVPGGQPGWSPTCSSAWRRWRSRRRNPRRSSSRRHIAGSWRIETDGNRSRPHREGVRVQVPRRRQRHLRPPRERARSSVAGSPASRRTASSFPRSRGSWRASRREKRSASFSISGTTTIPSPRASRGRAGAGRASSSRPGSTRTSSASSSG